MLDPSPRQRLQGAQNNGQLQNSIGSLIHISVDTTADRQGSRKHPVESLLAMGRRGAPGQWLSGADQHNLTPKRGQHDR